MKNFTIVIISFLIILSSFIISKQLNNPNNTEEKPYRIAFIRMKEGGQFWGTMRNGARTARTDTATIVDFYSTVDALDIEGQKKFIQKAIKNKVDCIIITPCDKHFLTKPLEEAEKEGIKVIQLFNEVENSQNLTKNRVMTDTYSIGKNLAKALMNKTKSEKNNILIISRSNSITSSKYMEEGIINELKQYDGIKISTLYPGSYITTASQRIEQYLLENPQINTIIALDDDCSESTIKSIIKLDKQDKIKIITTTHSLSNIQNLDTQVVDAILVINSFAMGYQSIHSAIDILEKRQIENLLIDYTIVTKENMFDKEIQRKLFPLI